ncbi:DNA primase regulatory subunit PriL [Candidatus Methanoperedens nitratireducens]|uniref:DNA primase large subunit PriL n=1 Tax=Candidatus Methanoperedens nitratireducens TaxID=1392998 RepID=A0A284VLD0_9EURY|nr:DNA primase regulatory subunit PriL [Candidatus Methanoperedens nitroreducens]SNQ60052.1 DNA primase large subunit PriL [Candidatus Methanoperedens nitroreducens]
MDVFGFAYFPFIHGALKYVESLDFKLDELFYDKAFEKVRERGKERVLQAIRDGVLEHEVSDRISAEKELLSYPVARILVSCINDGYLIRRYALAEAKSSYEQIKKLQDDVLKELAFDFDINCDIEDHAYAMHFSDYIRYASAIHEKEWKLINRKMNRGKVHLAREEFSRILEEAIRKRIESSLPVEVPDDIISALETYLEEIRSSLSARKSEFSIEEFREIMPDCFPPCMVHSLSNAQAGVNLAHSTRFALTSFLLNIGMNVEGIIELFKVSPDFDEERTRYQVMHIQGSTGTVYKSPSCATMTTYGNCFGKEPLCERISHPLGYYRKKAWILKKEKIAEKPE